MKKKTIIIMSAVVLALVIVIIVLLLTGGKKITITFDTDGGTVVSSLKIKKGSKTTLPKTTKENYLFDGWYLDNTKVDDSYEFNEDTTLKAHWKDEGEDVVFKVTFDTLGGTEIDPIEIKCGESLELPSEPTKEGYTFISWEDADKKTIHDNEKLACLDVTLYATWDKEDDLEDNSNLTIRFDSKGGSDVKAIKIKCRDAVVPTLPTPTKEGYIFTSWTNRNGKVFHEGATLTCDNVMLYANWKEDPNAKEYYTVTFDSKGGSKVDSIKVKCEEKLSLPNIPTKDGYNFVAWQDENGKAILDGSLLSCENITLYADWKEKEKNKEYTCSEGTLKNDKCIIEKDAEEYCPDGYGYSEKLSKCYKYISDESDNCPTDSSYKTATDLGGTQNSGCYSLTDKIKGCKNYSGYELSNGKCVKTIDAIEK